MSKCLIVDCNNEVPREEGHSGSTVLSDGLCPIHLVKADE